MCVFFLLFVCSYWLLHYDFTHVFISCVSCEIYIYIYICIYCHWIVLHIHLLCFNMYYLLVHLHLLIVIIMNMININTFCALIYYWLCATYVIIDCFAPSVTMFACLFFCFATFRLGFVYHLYVGSFIIYCFVECSCCLVFVMLSISLYGLLCRFFIMLFIHSLLFGLLFIRLLSACFCRLLFTTTLFYYV